MLAALTTSPPRGIHKKAYHLGKALSVAWALPLLWASVVGALYALAAQTGGALMIAAISAAVTFSAGCLLFTSRHCMAASQLQVMVHLPLIGMALAGVAWLTPALDVAVATVEKVLSIIH